jgi:ribosomal protein L24E
VKEKVPTVTCSFCGKEIEKAPNLIARNKSGLFFCDRDCQKAYFKSHGNYNRGKKVEYGYRKKERA